MTTIKSILAKLDAYSHAILTDDEVFVMNPDLKNALEQIEQLIEEVVGKIEQPYTSENPWEEDSRHARNRLRTEQRANLKKVIR